MTMDNHRPHPINRRTAIKIAAFGAVAAIAPFVLTRSRTAPKQIIVRDAGGIYSQIYKDILYQPFTQKTGIQVISATSGYEPTTEIRTMVETQRYLWDMAVISQSTIMSLTTGKVYLERHELEHDSVVSSILPQFISPYGVGTNVSTTVLAYRTDAFKGRRAPQSWQDLWDVEHFPGRRSLRKHPFGTIEAALLADHVPTNKVYPCDLERAFRSLNKIKPHVALWWTHGAQVEQLLKSGEVSLIPTYISRAQAAIDAGAPVAITWEQHIYGCESWAILKGTPNADACRQFILFASEPKQQALLAQYAIGPTQSYELLKKLIDPERAKLLQTYPDNLKRGLYIDASYWLKNKETVIERFNQWMIS